MNRWTKALARMLLAATLAAACAPAHAETPEEPTAAPTAGNLIEAARAALARGNLEDAEFLLEGVGPGEGNVDDLDFLHGSIAMARGDWEAAIARFRAMLARDPELPRVRLDLALAYFRARQDGNAAYHFRQALGEESLPPAARARALAFLDEIRRRRSWSLNGGIALAPDNNINAATSARLVRLFGLPAQLSEDARRTSGVGLSAFLSGGYEARLSADTRLRADAGLYTRTYEESRFNDRTLTLRAGPRFIFEDFDLRPELTGRFRELGGETYSRAAGLSLSGEWTVAPTWRLSASLTADRISYESFLDEGRNHGVRLGAMHALGPATLLSADASFRRETVSVDAHSWREYAVSLTAARELPRGFVVSAGPSHRWRRYDAPLLSLGPDPRSDRTLTGEIKASNRHVELFGFMPEITVRHERRGSNLDLYDYERTVAEIGVVRSF